jgi:hypothetical protein
MIVSGGTSHVTRHTSHVTRHTSHVTCSNVSSPAEICAYSSSPLACSCLCARTSPSAAGMPALELGGVAGARWGGGGGGCDSFATGDPVGFVDRL